MPTCPNGHQSGADDWCEVCGHRMAGPGAPRTAEGGAVPPPPRPGYGHPAAGGGPHPTAQAELCPQCRTPREAMAPFCEECRYNFLTQRATSYTPIAPAPQAPSPGLNLPPGFTRPPGPQVPLAPPPPGPQRPMAPPPGPQGPGAPGAAPGGFGDPIGQAGPTGHTGYPDPVGHPDPLSGPNAPGGPGSGPTGPGGPGAGADPFGYHPSRPSQLNRPAEVLGEEPGRAPFPPGPASPFPQGPAAPSGGPGAPDGPGAAHGAFAQQPSSTPTQQRQPPSTDDWMLPPPAQSSSPFPQGPGQPEPGHRDPGAAPGGHPSPGYPSPGTWTAVIGPDRAYFTAMMQRSGPDADGLNLPAYAPEQSVPLSGGQLTIGRRRQSTGEAPDIDLSVPPEDPGVSHKHAVLMRQADGSWAVIDQNSTNGTTLNGGEEPIQPYVPVPLNDGDRVHVGAWTTITIRRD